MNSKGNKETIKQFIQTFFELNHIEDKILNSKKKLKEIHRIKEELVDIIKDNEVLNKEIELFTSENTNNASAISNGNRNTNADSDHCALVIKDKNEESSKSIRAKTPDIHLMKKPKKDKGLNNTLNNTVNDNKITSKDNIGLNTFNQSNGTKFNLSKRKPNIYSEKMEREVTPIKNLKKAVKQTKTSSSHGMNLLELAKPVNSTNSKRTSAEMTSKQYTKVEMNPNSQTKPNGQKDKSRTPTPTPLSTSKGTISKKPSKKQKTFEFEETDPITSTTTTTVPPNKEALIDYINNKTRHITKCSANVIQSLNLCLQLNYLPSRDKITVIMCNAELYHLNSKVIQDYLISVIQLREIKLNELNARLSQYDNSLVYKQFTPSKTATNGLNFFTKEEESNIKTKSQPIQIINIFKTIYIMFNESFDHLEDNDIIPNIFNHILPHLKCDSFKLFLLNHLGKTIKCSDENIVKLIQFNAINPSLFSPVDIIKLNRTVSYMNFIVKEYYDYLTYKYHDGEYLYAIKGISKERDTLQLKINHLKSLLK